MSITVHEQPGPGPTVVMLHGVFMDHHLWDGVAGLLAPRHLLAVDMPGHGASEPSGDGDTLDDHVGVIETMLDGRGVGGALLAGHSWGGMVALRLARRRPDLVAGLVLTNTPLVRTAGAARAGFLAQELLLRVGFPVGRYGRLAAASLHGQAHRRECPETAEAMAARLHLMGRATVRRTIRSVILEPGDALEWLEELRIPWTLLAGEDDYVLGDDVQARLSGASGTIRIVPGGHSSPVESPREVAASIADLDGRIAGYRPDAITAPVEPGR